MGGAPVNPETGSMSHEMMCAHRCVPVDSCAIAAEILFAGPNSTGGEESDQHFRAVLGARLALWGELGGRRWTRGPDEIEGDDGGGAADDHLRGRHPRPPRSVAAPVAQLGAEAGAGGVWEGDGDLSGRLQ